MWIFACILFALGFMITAFKLSLAKKRRSGFIVALAVALLPLSFFPQAIRINMLQVTVFLGDYATLSSLCTVLILESVIFMWLFVHLMESHYASREMACKKIAAAFPSMGFLAGLLVIQIFLFNLLNGWAFWMVAGVYSAVVFLCVGIGTIAVRIVLRRDIWRLEALLVLIFLQLAMSMFLPMIVAGLQVPDTPFRADRFSMIVLGLCASVLIPSGALVSIFLQKRR